MIRSILWRFLSFLKELFSHGMMPYGIKTNEQIVSEVKNGYRLAKPQDCPDAIYDLMKQCWSPKPKERPSFQAIYDTIEKVFLIRILKIILLYVLLTPLDTGGSRVESQVTHTPPTETRLNVNYQTVIYNQ
jgi:hypothetical protein